MTITEKGMSDVKYIFHKWPSCHLRIGWLTELSVSAFGPVSCSVSRGGKNPHSNLGWVPPAPKALTHNCKKTEKSSNSFQAEMGPRLFGGLQEYESNVWFLLLRADKCFDVIFKTTHTFVFKMERAHWKTNNSKRTLNHKGSSTVNSGTLSSLS